MGDLSLTCHAGMYTGRFRAMAGPCEVLLDHDDAGAAQRQVEAVAAEAWRIERKFSRYRDDSIIQRINTAGGRAIRVDEETARLLDFATTLHELSGGRFDITSGVLRRAWKFDGSENIPGQAAVDALLPLIGWGKVQWQNPAITLPAGMEIDLGGCGKEYAVDRAFNLLAGICDTAMLVNFGGDLRARGPRRDGEGWKVGIERPDLPNAPAETMTLSSGAVATSGDTHRFLVKDGVRYGHVLNPRTGWPVQGGPRAVTLLGGDCMQAGMLATLALLWGPDAESFLRGQEGIVFWLIW